MNLREALQIIYERNGALTPVIVYEEAASPVDEAGQYFTDRLPWDDEEAAYQHRLDLCARFIRKAKIVYKPTPKSSLREVRAYWPVATETGRSYEPTESIAADPLLSKLMLQQAEREWRDLKARYGHLKAFVELVQSDLEKIAA